MSYTKTNWHDGDTITAVKMNKIENGIESSLSDALVTLGKALCGDSLEVKPGLTDAETILEIAKNYTGGGDSGSGGGKTRLIELMKLDRRKENDPDDDDYKRIIYSGYEAGLGFEDLCGSFIMETDMSAIAIDVIRSDTDTNGEDLFILSYIDEGDNKEIFYLPATGEFFYRHEDDK